MELLAIILSGLITLVSPAGLILDRTLAKAFREQFEEVEQLAVRVDNAPSYSILQGKVERVRVASRGVKLGLDLRIDTLEFEIDPIADARGLSGNETDNQSDNQPLQGAIRLVITEEDINQALESQKTKAILQELINGLIPSSGDLPQLGYELLNLRLQFLDNNRFQLQVGLARPGSGNSQSQPLDLVLESEVKVVGGSSFRLIEPEIWVNGNPITSRLIIETLSNGVSRFLDLRQLEGEGIIARILQLERSEDGVHLAAFVRFDPKANVLAGNDYAK